MHSAGHPPKEIASSCILGADGQVVCCEEALPEGDDVWVCQQAVIDNLTLHVLVQAAHLALQTANKGVTLCLALRAYQASFPGALCCGHGLRTAARPLLGLMLSRSS